jgi:DNA-binding transcriptional LysR family regulator
MQSAVSGDPAELTGLVRIDMPMTFCRSLFMPHLAALLEGHPRLTVEVRMNDHHVNLVAEGVDLALRLGELADSELVVRKLGRLRMGTYARPSCLARHGTPAVPSDLSSHRLLAFLLPSGRPKPMVYAHGSSEMVVDTGQAVASFTNGDAMIDAALAGIGIVQTPAFYAKQGLAQGLLAQILPGQDAPGPALQLVYPSRQHLPKRVRVLIDYIADVIEDGLGDVYRFAPDAHALSADAGSGSRS